MTAWSRSERALLAAVQQAALKAVVALPAVALLGLAGLAAASVGAVRTNRVARLSANRLVVTVSGTVSCSRGNAASLHVDLTQAWLHAEGWSTTMSCAGTGQRWVVQVRSRGRAFRHGRAIAYADVTTFDEEGVITGGHQGRERVLELAR